MDTGRQLRDLLANDQEPSVEYWQAKVECLQKVVLPPNEEPDNADGIVC